MDESYTSDVTGNITHDLPKGEDRSGTALAGLFERASELGIRFPQEAMDHWQRAQEFGSRAKASLSGSDSPNWPHPRREVIA